MHNQWVSFKNSTNCALTITANGETIEAKVTQFPAQLATIIT